MVSRRVIRVTESIWALFVNPANEGRDIGPAQLALACDTVRFAGFDTATLSTEPGTGAG